MIKRFLDFVEMRTKLATILPFLTALAYVFYTTGRINFTSTLIYIPASLMLDMAVTAINHHFEDVRERKLSPHYPKWVSLGLIAAMLLGFAAVGLYLVSIHGLTLLLAGGFCLAAGVAYSFGPAPISKSSYGELVSGFVVGTVVMFIVTTINDPSFQPLGLGFDAQSLRLSMDIDLAGLALFGIVTLPAALCGANIMLANNICDAQADRQTRYTLVHNIGRRGALGLYVGLYCAAYLSIVVSVLIGSIPVICLASLVTLIPVRKNVRRFLDKQSKDETFVLSVKNFVLILCAYALTMALGRLV
ncbi:MAG: UbiA family prenyltransferase [Oscillospiraceae bacterium]|nr:UbiA family prenyltransferase [Oscillospiraceae bacterium]